MSVKKENVKSRLLQEAANHIAHNGLESFTTKAIATKAKTGTIQIYEHFDDQDGLIEAVFSHGWYLMQSKIHQKLVAARGAEPGKIIKEIISAVFEAFEENRDLQAATAVLGHTVGSPLREKLKKSQGFKQQETLVMLFATTCRVNLPEERIDVVTQIIFGALHRLLFCLTPYKNKKKSLSSEELQERRRITEEVLSDIIEGRLLKEKPPTGT